MYFNLVTGAYLKLVKVIHTAYLVLRENNTQVSSKVFPFQFITELDDTQCAKKFMCITS